MKHTYKAVEVSAPGFKRFLQADVTLTAAGTVRLDAQLTLGQLSETVQVVPVRLRFSRATCTSAAVAGKLMGEVVAALSVPSPSTSRLNVSVNFPSVAFRI